MTVDELIDLLAASAGVFDAPPPEGDPVDILEHGLQCADRLRETAPDDVELQLAGLTHDLGHVVRSSDPDHAAVAARLVEPALGERVAILVGAHVAAKRYLAATESYPLSAASLASLRRQGDVMSADEVRAFEARPYAADAVTLRRADEAAKVVGATTGGLATWAPILREHAAAVAARSTAL